MINMTSELREKLLAATSAEEAVALVKADGQEIKAEETARLWEEIERVKEQDARGLSKDELDAVSAGRDHYDFPSGCAMMFLA